MSKLKIKLDPEKMKKELMKKPSIISFKKSDGPEKFNRNVDVGIRTWAGGSKARRGRAE